MTDDVRERLSHHPGLSTTTWRPKQRTKHRSQIRLDYFPGCLGLALDQDAFLAVIKLNQRSTDWADGAVPSPAETYCIIPNRTGHWGSSAFRRSQKELRKRHQSVRPANRERQSLISVYECNHRSGRYEQLVGIRTSGKVDDSMHLSSSVSRVTFSRCTMILHACFAAATHSYFQTPSIILCECSNGEKGGNWRAPSHAKLLYLCVVVFPEIHLCIKVNPGFWVT